MTLVTVIELVFPASLCPSWCVVSCPAGSQEDEDARVKLLLLEPRWQDSHPGPAPGRTGRSRLDLLSSIFPAVLNSASRCQATKATVAAAQPVLLLVFLSSQDGGRKHLWLF